MVDDTKNQTATTESVSLAITGASGIQYGFRLLECLIASQVKVFLMVSDAAYVVAEQETSLDIPQGIAQRADWFQKRFGAKDGQLIVCGKTDWLSPVASGSAAPHKMVICPASGGSLSAVAMGASNNLIERAADVVLKERHTLILVPRETPYSTIHLENMLKLSQMGAVILPASPGFYFKPEKIESLIDFIVARILDQLNIKQTIVPRWGLE